jgi:hypothetical protein
MHWQQALINITATAVDDTLIDWRSENIIKVSSFVIVIAVSTAVGIISSKVEHAVIFALICSVIAVAFFLVS